jgi:uncharacterized membrane protein
MAGRNTTGRAARGALWLLFALLSAAIATYAFRYLYAEINLHNPFHLAFALAGNAVPLHFFGAGLALLLAPVQVLSAVRIRWPRLHRLLGWLYVLAVLQSGLAGLWLAPNAQGGWPTGLAFSLLAISWLVSTGLAVAYAVGRRYEQHRRWMLRSVALTFAAVTLRLYLVFGLAVLRVDFDIAYLAAAWLCWTLNLFAMEAYLRWRPLARPLRVPDTRSASQPSGA